MIIANCDGTTQKGWLHRRINNNSIEIINTEGKIVKVYNYEIIPDEAKGERYLCEHCNQHFYEDEMLVFPVNMGLIEGMQTAMFCPHCKEETKGIIDNEEINVSDN